MHERTSKKFGEEEERCYLAWDIAFQVITVGGGAKTIVAHGVVEGMVGEGFFFFAFFFIKCKKYIDKK